jgi:hypothetical protein
VGVALTVTAGDQGRRVTVFYEGRPRGPHSTPAGRIPQADPPVIVAYVHPITPLDQGLNIGGRQH